jgi:hypothetical protein
MQRPALGVQENTPNRGPSETTLIEKGGSVDAEKKDKKDKDEITEDSENGWTYNDQIKVRRSFGGIGSC